MTLRRGAIATGLVFLVVVISEVIRYRVMSQEERLPYLFELRSMVAVCSIPAIAVGVVVFLFFLFDPIPTRKR